MSDKVYTSSFSGAQIDEAVSKVLNNETIQELYAYPADTHDGKENKVVELGSDAMYCYVGELVASEDGLTEVELTNEAYHTFYLYQPIYDGKYRDYF